jgi:hypothetical protein
LAIKNQKVAESVIGIRPSHGIGDGVGTPISELVHIPGGWVATWELIGPNKGRLAKDGRRSEQAAQ